MKQQNNNFKNLETMGVLAFACLVFWILTKYQPLLYISASLLFIGLFIKGLSAKLSGAWLKFGALLGTVNTKVILTIIFFLFLTPIAILYRFFKGDTMKIKNDHLPETHWNDRNHEYEPADFEKQW